MIVDIDAISSLEEFYNIFDEQALLLERESDTTGALLKYKAKCSSDTDKKMMQWEVEISAFIFKGNTVFSFAAGNGTSPGEVREFPSLDEYQKEAFDYMKDRSETTASALLMARYNHALWLSPIKNRSFAILASESYISSIDQCLRISEEKPTDYYHLIGELYESLVAIIQAANIPTDEVKKLTQRLLYDRKIPFWLQHDILKDMLANPKIFKPSDFEGTLTIFDNQLKHIKDNRIEDFMMVKYHLHTAVRIAQKIKSDVKVWYDEIGSAYLRMAEGETEEGRYWIKQSYYMEAIDAFRQSGNQVKKLETEQLYFELKPNITLDYFHIDYDDETLKKFHNIQNDLKRRAANLLKLPAGDIYAIIRSGDLFPKYEDMAAAAKDKEAHFLDFITTLHFDANKNIGKFSPEGDEKREILEIYGQRIKATLLPFLHHVIVQGIKSGHLTSRNFLQFLMMHSWIGQPHVKYDLSGNPEEINWIFQITPAIVEFFNQVLAWGESKYYRPSFILCTDSLTLKIEGLFRNFSERINVSTSMGKKKGMQEALAHDVLNNQTIRKYFDESDRLLFDYVFSNEGGLNLRNNIAHCFYSENEYHPDKMLLLLVVLLRLGKYTITMHKKNN